MHLLGLEKLKTYPSTFRHGGLDELASSSNDGVVDLGRNLDLRGGDVSHPTLDLLNLGDSISHILLLASNGDHVAVSATVRQVNLGICFISDPSNVSSTLANDKLVELLEDEDHVLVAALGHLLGNLWEVLGEHLFTSFFGPLSLTMSFLTPRSGKLIWT